MPVAFICVNNFLRQRTENVPRRRLRGYSDPLSTPESTFIMNYRLNKEAFVVVLEEIRPHIKATRSSSIHLPIKLAATLLFLAIGSFQRVIGKDLHLKIERTHFCKILWVIIGVLEREICPKWIRLNQTDEEVQESKTHFYTRHRIPGVVGCIDGTRTRINKPQENERAYNRKEYFSINAMVICDHKMKVRCIDDTKPGASHDSFIWNLSSARNYFLTKYNAGERGSWLIGDSGYALEPFLLTPFRSPQPNSAQHMFNFKHSAARNVVERVIGVIKSRFRCLQGTLLYVPLKCVRLINVCCALHNICRVYNVPDEEFSESHNDLGDDEFLTDEDPSVLALNIRNLIATTMFR